MATLPGPNNSTAERTLKPEPRFSDLNKVRITRPGLKDFEGYVIGSQFRGGRWIYKISFSEGKKPEDTFNNWLPEEWLERIS